MKRVALVTGGSRGIGLGITKGLIADGARVAMLATRPEPEGLVDELGGPDVALYVQASVADLDQHPMVIGKVLEHFGRIDILVNNAGVAPSERLDILEAKPESYDRVMGINLRGPYFLTQAVANQMIAQDPLEGWGVRGTIVNVSSISATHVSPNRGEYVLSKAGVAMATQMWARRLASEGIVVHEVRPGVIATDMTAGVKDKYDALFAQGVSPMPRWGTPEDVGGAVVALCGGGMPYTTGGVLHVDGGMNIPEL